MSRLLSQFRLSQVSKFSKKDKQELVQFQGLSIFSILKPFIYFLLVVYVIAVVYGLFASFETVSPSYERAVSRLQTLSSPGAQSLIQEHRALVGWLQARGTSGELAVFNSASQWIFGFVGAQTGSFMTGLYEGLMRIVFLMVASSRLCLLALLFAIYAGKTSLKPYESEDMLGLTGSGSLFYTGIKAKLENLTPEGIPDKHITGLACPQVAELSEIQESGLGELLAEQEIDTETNLALAGVILELDNLPAYVASKGQEKQLLATFQDDGLPTMALEALRAALSVRQQCETGREIPLNPADYTTDTTGNYNPETYGRLLAKHFYRVLSPKLRHAMTNIDPAIIASTVLSVFAGKVLDFHEAGGRWFSTSAFPQLCARSILHSLPMLPQDYDYATRSLIRRALIYGKRSSVFGAVRFPSDLSMEVRALRQWVELLLASPNEISKTSVEAEYFHLIRELNDSWSKVFTEESSKLDEEFPHAIHATKTNLLVVPIEAALTLIRKAISDQEQQRLQLLTKLVNEIQANSQQSDEEAIETLKTEIPEYERVFAPFSKKTLKTLTTLHGLDEQGLKLWSAFRMVLFHNGWLSRRVGDYTVPEAGIFFTILSGCSSDSEKNELGFVGQRGMTAFRASRIKVHLGEDWQRDFYTAKTASMAEDEAHFERQLKGIADEMPDDDEFSVIGA